LPTLAPYASYSADHIPYECGDLVDLVDMIGHGFAYQRRLRKRSPSVRGLAGSVLGSRHSDGPREQVRRGDAIGQGMVHLAHERVAVVGHAFDKVELPQGTASVQWSARDFTDQLVEFTAAARTGQAGPAQVIVEVYLGGF
jgi:hypothetical protein